MYAFNNLTAKVGVEGKVTSDLMARVVLKVRDSNPGNEAIEAGGTRYLVPTDGFNQSGNMTVNTTPSVTPNTKLAEDVWLDEANLDFTMHVWPRAHMIVGRQFQSYGMGLLVNNARQSQEGLRFKWNDLWKTGLGFDAFVGGADYTMSTLPFQATGDGYESMRLFYQKPNWSLAANWMPDGVGQEAGWSADAWARFWGGREVQAEFAEQYMDVYGHKYAGSDPNALMATLDIWKGRHWYLKGYTSYADANYNPFYSTVNPYFELYGNEDGTLNIPWERWLNNPLVEPNINVWGGKLNFDWCTANWTAQYYALSGRSMNWGNSMWGDPDGDMTRNLAASYGGVSTVDTENVPYSQLWAISVKKPIANGVDLNVTYAQELLSSATQNANPGLKDAQLLVAGIAVGF
jgi:hypothetical protein